MKIIPDWQVERAIEVILEEVPSAEQFEREGGFYTASIADLIAELRRLFRCDLDDYDSDDRLAVSQAAAHCLSRMEYERKVPEHFDVELEGCKRVKWNPPRPKPPLSLSAETEEAALRLVWRSRELTCRLADVVTRI